MGLALTEKQLGPDGARLLALGRRGCAARDATACVWAAEVVLPPDHYGVAPDPQAYREAAALYLSACRIDGLLCREGGQRVRDVMKHESQTMFELGCLRGDQDACSEAGMINDVCKGGDSPACRALRKRIDPASP